MNSMMMSAAKLSILLSLLVIIVILTTTTSRHFNILSITQRRHISSLKIPIDLNELGLIGQQSDPNDFKLMGNQLRLFNRLYESLQSQTMNAQEYIRIKSLYDRMRINLFKFLKPELFSIKKQGYGIVMCVGSKLDRNVNSVQHAYSTLLSIRQIFHFDIPVEVFYLGNDDLVELDRIRFQSIKGVRVVDLAIYIDNSLIGLHGFDMKPFAVLASVSQHTILIDADTNFLQSPKVLFDSPKYKSSGSLFFNDRTINHKNPNQLDILNSMFEDPSKYQHLHMLQGKTAYEMESGVVVIDSARHYTSLLAACKLLDRGFKEITYSIIYGDKETFWIGFAIMGSVFDFATDYRVGATGISTSRQENERTLYKICSVQVFHLDEFGAPLWINGGLSEGKFDNAGMLHTFDEWLVEPGSWSAAPHSKLCLETESIPEKFTDAERDIIAQQGALFTDSKNR